MRLNRVFFQKTPWVVAVAMFLSVSAFAIVATPHFTSARAVSPDPGVSECGTQVGTDLSTGTNGTGAASADGTFEGSWVLTNTVPANGAGTVAVPAGAPLYVVSSSLWVVPTPAGRFAWISPEATPQQTGSMPAGVYIYKLTFAVSGPGGQLNLYEFDADNKVALTLTGPTPGGPWSSTGAFQSFFIGTTGLNLLPGTYTFTAAVTNYPYTGTPKGTATGFAVYAVFCPAGSVGPGTASFVYTAKYVCNPTNPSLASNIGLEPGLYGTDINILNPSYLNTSVPFSIKFTMAQPMSTTIPATGPPQVVSAVPPSPYVIRTVILRPDAALRLDCNTIMTYLPVRYTGCHPLVTCTAAVKGFVEIFTNGATDPSGTGLNVWAEYSVASCGATLKSPGVCTTAPVASSLQLVQVTSDPYTP